MRKGSPEDYRLEIDLKPGLTPEQLDKRIQRDLARVPTGIWEHSPRPAAGKADPARAAAVRHSPDTKANTHQGAAAHLGGCIRQSRSTSGVSSHRRGDHHPWRRLRQGGRCQNDGIKRCEGCISPERSWIWTAIPAALIADRLFHGVQRRHCMADNFSSNI
ncbi:MAG: hypothetical protein ACLR5S_06990 [Ruminococcus sp.]